MRDTIQRTMRARDARSVGHVVRFVATLALGAGAGALAHCASAPVTVCDCPVPDGSVRVAINACTADQADGGCRTTVYPGEGPLPPPELSALWVASEIARLDG